jgi:hypothetical protein
MAFLVLRKFASLFIANTSFNWREKLFRKPTQTVETVLYFSFPA